MWSNRFNLLLSNPKQNVQLASAKTTRVLGNKCDLFLSLDQSDPIYVQQILHEIIKCRLPSSTEKERKA
jgi:hypothetical protein